MITDTDRADYDLAADALTGSIFRMLRQGQRVVFDLDGEGRATKLVWVPRSTWGLRRRRRGSTQTQIQHDEVEA